MKGIFKIVAEFSFLDDIDIDSTLCVDLIDLASISRTIFCSEVDPINEIDRSILGTTED